MSNFTHTEVYVEGHQCLPKVLISPSKYIQGPGVLKQIGRYVGKLLSPSSIALMITKGGLRRNGPSIKGSLEEHKIAVEDSLFQGQCSYEEADRVYGTLKSGKHDAILAVGGGKLIDLAKLVANKLGVPLVVCSSLSSTDGPCSALSIIYSPEDAYAGGEVYPCSPNIVVMDTEIIAKSPFRTLVSGMGDAMATYYEARTVFENPKATTMLEARPTRTALALAELCANLLYAHGEAGAAACIKKEVTEDLEAIVEANTLLSGLGFESGGLAAAHAIAQAMTAVKFIEETYMHGEMVAMGLLTMLCMEKRDEEAKKVAEFFAAVGLPNNFTQFKLDLDNKEDIDAVVKLAQVQWFIRNEPFEVTDELVVAALADAHKVGLAVEAAKGRAAFDNIHKPKTSSKI